MLRLFLRLLSRLRYRGYGRDVKPTASGGLELGAGSIVAAAISCARIQYCALHRWHWTLSTFAAWRSVLERRTSSAENLTFGVLPHRGHFDAGR